ncbi:Ubiquitin--protein ligase [Trichostrongylus colubriformis]|uniref:Ubiquitin--protein ligase n=1 Tax=Trichostrongylus colubriformis TaxID=6319 RepID=A0AAN8FVX6_TRICO
MSGEGQNPVKCVEETEATHSHKGSSSPLEKSANLSNLNSRRPGVRHSSHYEPNLKSIYRCCDFTRPWASKEDTVVYLKRGEIGLAHVHKIDRKKLDASRYRGLISCQTLELETIPSCRRICRLMEEVLVVDRGFSIGETVIKFENQHIGDPEKEDLCTPRSDAVIGQVVNVEVRGDVLVVPSKNLIVKNVSLGNNEYTEMVNYNSAHNYVMYKDWIGNASDCINDITLLYRGRHRFVVKEGGRSGVFLCRQDRSDESKALVPGERVSIALSDALGRSASWEQKPPRTLTCSRRRRATEGIKCVIEKIETNSLIVDWIMSPSSTTKPSKVIPKSEIPKVTRIDPSANPRPSTCDRVKIMPDDSSTASFYSFVVTINEYFTGLTDQYRPSFRKLLAKNDKSGLLQPGKSSARCQKEQKEEEVTVTVKAAKIARLSAEVTLQGKEGDSVSAPSVAECEVTVDMMESNEVVENDGEAWESSEESSGEEPSSFGRSRVAASRSVARQKRMRKCPARRRRCTPALLPEVSRLAKDLFGNQFIGEVLMSRTLVDVQWMNGRIEEKIPGYLLIPHDPDLDQQDHLPGVIVARKEAQNAEKVFGLILSTNSAERSCNIAWFERTENAVKELGEEECILFDIMAHPIYKRLFIGNYGVSINHLSNDMRDIAFQVVADLKNGKQLVRFLNGTEEELWPFDILPINFVDESLDSNSDDDDDDLSTTEGESSKDSTSLSLILMEASNILCRLGLYSCKDHQVADQDKILGVVSHFIENFPELEEFCKDVSPEDNEARNATGKQNSEYIGALERFADVIIAIYRSRALPDNFDVQLLSSFVDECVRGEAFTANIHLDEDNMIPLLIEAEGSARSRPEWLSIFHYVSECICGSDENSVRLPLRSRLYQHDDASHFKARHLSWEYVDSVAEDVRIAHEVCDCDSTKDSPSSEIGGTVEKMPLSNKPPSVIVEVKASAQDMNAVLQRPSFVMSLIEQVLGYSSWPTEEVKLVAKKVPTNEERLHSRSKETRETTVKRTFASALVLLCRCGLLSYNSLCQNSLWKELNHIFEMKYEAPRLIKYPTLHEIIMFIRSVDYHYPAMMHRLMDVTQAYSFDSIYFQVKSACQQNLKAAGDTCEMFCDLRENETLVKGAAGGVKDKSAAGTFEVLDEYPVKNELFDGLPSRKFYSAVFKEHKVLSEHVPDSIHVHAFANRLNILHVLIMGPVGTPFDTTPFFFKFKLPPDYPQKPPEVLTRPNKANSSYKVTYVAYSQEQLNPNLYQNGKVCTSLLGTWSGQGVETWNPVKSNILQVLLSIQALILVPEPYFNEAGYESRKQQSEMSDRSRRYNETATVNSLEYLLKIYMEPPSDFEQLIKSFVEKAWIGLRQRINSWISGSGTPSFPVMGSKGFKMALEKAVDKLNAVVKTCETEESSGEPMELGVECQSTSKTMDEERNERFYEWTITAEMKKPGM